MKQSGVEATLNTEVTAIIAEVNATGFAIRTYRREYEQMFWTYKATIYSKLKAQGYFADQVHTYWYEVTFAAGYLIL